MSCFTELRIHGLGIYWMRNIWYGLKVVCGVVDDQGNLYVNNVGFPSFYFPNQDH